MAIDFPTSPTPNQLHTAGSRSWSWNNSVGAWYAVNAGVQGIQGIQGTQGTQGLQGITGSQGTQGTQGSQGTQGVQGIQGITGLAFTIAKTYLSVAALNADTAPTAIVAGQFALINTTNVEDAENSRLYIWTGSTYTFVDDLSGSAGIQGITGSQGVQGIQGIQGIQGLQGTQGTQGIQGIQGTAGFVGSNGAQGTQGQQGIQGIQGITGSQGITGAQGITGTNGAQGTVGTTGAQGTVGTQGAGGLTTLTATSVVATVAGTSSTELVRGNMADNDQFRILVGGTATNAGYVEIATADDGTEPIYVRQYTGVFSSLARTATLLDGSGNTSFPGTISASNFSGSHSGTSSGTNTGDQTNISGNAATVSSITGNTGLMVNRLTPTAFVDTLTTANFRSTLFGTTTNAEAIATARWNTTPAPLSGLASYGTMIAWGANDTQGFLALNYNTAGAIIGGGYGNNISWSATLLHSGNYTSYSPSLTGSGASGSWGISVTGNSANITAYTINQSVGSGNSPTFTEVYANGWFRNVSTQGLYNGSYGHHFYATSDAYWNIAGNNASICSLIMRTGGHQGTIRGYLYSDSSNNVGLLNSAGNWTLQMVGGDYGLFNGSSARAPLFYDSNNTAYYTDPASTSNLNAVSAAGNIATSATYARNAAGVGYLNGGYASQETSTTTGPIYCINSANYAPTATTFGVMHGVGYTHSNTGLMVGGASGWGFYSVVNGVQKAFIGDGGMNLAGAITATGNITAYYSDERLKRKTGSIQNALEKVLSLHGFYYVNNELASTFGYTDINQQVGLSAQEVEKVLPEIVSLAPFDLKTEKDGTIVSKSGEDYKTIDYSKLVPLLIEAIKELKSELNELKAQYNNK